MSAPSPRLFVGGLAYEATEADLEGLFARVGTVARVSIKRDRDTGRSRGFGFVEMASVDDAQRAILELNGAEILGRAIRVQAAEPRRADATDPFLASAPSPAEAKPTPPTHTAAPAPVAPPPAPAPAAAPSRRPTVVAGLVALGLVALALGWFWPRPTADSGATRVLVIAKGTDVDELALAAFAQALAVNLATSPQLSILPVADGLALGRRPDAEQLALAKERGADIAVLVDVSRKANKLHLRLTVLRVAEERLLWGAQRDGDDAEIWPLASALAAQVATALGVSVAPRYEHVTSLSGPSAMASAPLTSQVLGALRRGELAAADSATAKLVERFGAHPEAWALRCHAVVLRWDALRGEAARRDLDACLLELDRRDPHNPYAEVYRGLVESQEQRAAQAVVRFDAVVARTDLAPTARAWVLRYRAVAQQSTGNAVAALADLEESMRLDPTNPWTLGILANALSQAGRHDEALPRAEQAVALAPSLWRSHQTLGVILTMLERRGEAARAFGRACELSSAQEPCGLEAVSFLKAGEKAAAERAARRAQKLGESTWGAYNLACYWALVGDQRAALDWLGKARKHGVTPAQLVSDDDLVSLRKLPEFATLAKEDKL